MKHLFNGIHRENCVLLNPVKEFIEIEALLLPMLTLSMNFYTIYFHMLKSV